MSALVTLAEVKTTLDISDNSEDAKLAQFIDGASAAAETYCRTVFALTDRDEVHAGGAYTIVLDFRPLISLDAVLDRNEDPELAEDLSDVDADSAAAILSRTDGSKWGKGRRRWRTQYRSGYASAPSDVRAAIIQTVAAWRQDPGNALTSERLGDYAWTRDTAATALPAGALAILDARREGAI